MTHSIALGILFLLAVIAFNTYTGVPDNEWQKARDREIRHRFYNVSAKETAHGAVD
jgi:hypothetical protein